MPNSPLFGRLPNLNRRVTQNNPSCFSHESLNELTRIEMDSPKISPDDSNSNSSTAQKDNFLHKYEILREIGNGEYGSVFVAQSNTTGEYFAIKKIENVFADLRELKRIIREVKLMKRFRNSPFVVGLQDMYFFPSAQNNNYHLFLVMELMEEDLHTHLQRGPLPVPQARRFLFQLLLALKEMHSKSIIHRDIRPKNILLKGNSLKVSDFGMGRRQSFRQSLLDITTLRMYRAPEGFFGVNNYTGAVDIWSAACVFLEMIGKVDLIKSKNDPEQLEKIFSLFGGPSTDICNNLTVKYAHNIAAKYEGKQPTPLHHLLALDAEGVDLLSKMFKIDWTERITAAQAVLHPWFSSCWKEITPKEAETEDVVAYPDKRPDSPDIGDLEEGEIMKKLLWKEVLIYDDSIIEE